VGYKEDSPTREELEDLQLDPGIKEDLGYEIEDWNKAEYEEGTDNRKIFLPSDEEMLKDETFIVICPDDLINLSEKR